LGNNSGRNLGDAAILAGILNILTEKIPRAKFYVPSITPNFINDNYGKEFDVKGINIMPWTGSLRLLGIPTLYCIAKSDLALICDGIIFGRQLFSPHNFLITLIFLVPWARLFNCRVICYSCGIGPFPNKLSKLFARWVISKSDLIMMRDHDSKRLAEEIGVKKPIKVTGDAAFLNRVSDDEKACKILEQEKIDPKNLILGINVTTYLDSWLNKSEKVENRSDFFSELNIGIRNAVSKLSDESTAKNFNGGVQIVIFSASPMDENISHKIARKIGAKVIDNSRYLSHEIQSVMRKCELLVGMRFHSLVLASAVGVPVVGLIYAPKVRGFMRLINCEELGIELANLNSEVLCAKIIEAWNNRASLKVKQQKVISALKLGAEEAAIRVNACLR
jgi:polysaccharide pyruvyl transferase WcaK-like protein